ncbi:MAG: cytosine permease [Beutenbergiaceae bacterium]
MSNDTQPSPESPTEVVDRDYPMAPVPLSERKSFWSLLVVLLGFTVFTPTMLAGAQLATAFTFGPLLGVILVGSVLLGLYVATMGYIGSKTRLTTVVMARYSFGSGGAKLASILLGGTQIGWFGVVVGTIGNLTAQAFGWGDSVVAKSLIMVAVATLMCLTALRGFRGMFYASAVATPLALILAFWVAWTSVGKVGGTAALFELVPQEVGTMSVAVAITSVIGTFISAGTQVPNWTRFASSASSAIWACVAAFLIGNGLMILFGAIGATAHGIGDYVEILYALGLMVAGVLLLFGNLWTTNVDTAYAFGVAGAELFNKPTKAPFIIGGTIIATLLALFGIEGALVPYLGLLGTFIPPLGAVIIADYFRRWRHGMPELSTLPALDVPNLAAYLVASAAAYTSGLLELGIPPIVGVAIAMGIVLLWPRPATQKQQPAPSAGDRSA